MTSAAKIAANRRNARKSTGPRSQAGKMRSRRNAFRHGLAIPIASDIVLAGQIEPLTNELAATATQPAQHAAARIAALAQLELARAQSVKVQIIDRAAQITQEKNSYDSNTLAVLGYAQQLKMLVQLDRYERRALSRRNRALRALDLTRVHQSKMTAVRWCKLFVQPAWAFNVHALVKVMLESMSHGGDWICPQIEGLRVALDLRGDQSGSIWFAFSQDPKQEFAIAKVLRRRGGRQWGVICPTTGKTVEDLLLRDSERRIGSRYALGLSYRSKHRKSVPAHPVTDVAAASVSNEVDTRLSRLQHSEPKGEQWRKVVDDNLLDDQQGSEKAKDAKNIIPSTPRADREERSSEEPSIPKAPPNILNLTPENEVGSPVDVQADRNLDFADELHAICVSDKALAKAIASLIAEPKASQVELAAPLPFDLKLGIRLKSEGKLDDARRSYRRAVATCKARLAEDASDAQSQYHFGLAVSELGELAFDFLVDRRIETALQTITEAMSYQTDWLWLELVHAHILMLTARKTDALNIHRRNYTRTMDNGEAWGASISADFAVLREAGYNIPIMDEIERQFARND